MLINYLPHSEGLSLDLKIEKESVKLLVDTGANHSILSMHLFNKLKLSENQIQTLRNVNIITATGESSPCLGQIVLPVVVDKQQILQNFWVADIQNEDILGLDFLSENKCIVTIDPQSLEINSLLVPLSLKNTKDVVHCCRKTILENVVVSSESEIVLAGKSSDKLPPDSYAGIIETHIDKTGVLVAMSLISSDCTQVPLRVAKSSSEPCTIYKNTVVATCEPVDLVNIDHVEPNGSEIKDESLDKTSELSDCMAPVLGCQKQLNEFKWKRSKLCCLNTWPLMR